MLLSPSLPPDTTSYSQQSSPPAQCSFPTCLIYMRNGFHTHSATGFPAVRIAARSTEKVNPDAAYPNEPRCSRSNEFCPGLQTLDYWIRAKHYKTNEAKMLQESEQRWNSKSKKVFSHLPQKKNYDIFMKENSSDMIKLSESVTTVFTYLPFLNHLGEQLDTKHKQITGKAFPAKAFDDICTVAVHWNSLRPEYAQGLYHRAHRVYVPDRIRSGAILPESKHSLMRKVLDEVLAEHLDFKGSVSFIGFIPSSTANLYASEHGFTDDYLTSSPLHNKYTHLIQQGAQATAGTLKKKHFPAIIDLEIWGQMFDLITFKMDQCTEVDDVLLGSATNPLNHQLICGMFSRGVRNILIEQNESVMRTTLQDYFGITDITAMSKAECTAQLEKILLNLECVETYILDSLFKGMDKYAERVNVRETRFMSYRILQPQPPSLFTCAEDLFKVSTLTCGDFLVPLTYAAKKKGEKHCSDGSGKKVQKTESAGYVILQS